jgi:hypothetical protein
MIAIFPSELRRKCVIQLPHLHENATKKSFNIIRKFVQFLNIKPQFELIRVLSELHACTK